MKSISEREYMAKAAQLALEYAQMAVLAAILSWDHNHSILWMVAHSFCSWFYVIYYWWRH
jgi:hypothetical protein